MPELLCPVYGESWDTDELHDEAVTEMTYEEAQSMFRKVGCEVFGASHNEQSDAAGLESPSEMLGDADEVATEIENGRSVHDESQEADHSGG